MPVEVPGFSVRPATPADARGVATVHVASWRAAYAGLLPQPVLDGLSVDVRTERWTEIFGRDRGTTVALDGTDTVVGFASTGPSRDDDGGPDVGELYAIYVSPEVWGRGVGRLLHDVALAGLTSYAVVTLWVIEGNARGRAFYERQGWRVDGATQTDDFEGADAPEVRYRRPLP